jgi:hypothetical protein
MGIPAIIFLIIIKIYGENFMDNTDIDSSEKITIMGVEEVAQYLRKSQSWVYKNWKILGGRKLGGSLFFPRKEELHERIFYQREGVEIRLHPKRDQVHQRLVQNQNRGQKGRKPKKGGTKEPETSDRDSNRHGLLGVGQQEAGSC